MTVTTSTARVVHNGNGTTIDFAVPFRFLENAHVAVFLRDAAGGQAQWVENTQYTLAGADDAAGGTLTVIASPTDYTPASGEKLVIIRAVPITQETDYVENDPFPAETHERAIDKLTMVNQEQTERLDRTFTIPETDTLAGSFELPIDTLRAGNFLAFDGSGNPIVAAGTAPTTAPITPFAETLLDDADAATARTSLGVAAATETVAGLVERATQAETDAGIDDERYITALKLATLPAIADPAIPMAKSPPEISNNGTDAANDIDVAAKSCRDDLDAANMPAGSALTKQIDVDWAEGTDQGGFPSGLTLANDTSYHFFKIGKTDGTVDAGFDTDLAASNLLADATGFTLYRRLGTVRRDTAANRPFIQVGDRVWWKTPAAESTAAITAMASTITLSTPPSLPIEAQVSVYFRHASSGTHGSVYLSSPDQTDVAADNSNSQAVERSSAEAVSAAFSVPVLTNTSAQVRVRSNVTTNNTSVNTHGYVDRRGRDS